MCNLPRSNAYTSRLVNLLESGEYSGQAALEIVASGRRHPMPEVVIKAGLEAMRDLQTRGVLLGVVQAPCLYSRNATRQPLTIILDEIIASEKEVARQPH